MPSSTRILLVDSNPSDLELAATVLQRDLPAAEVISANDGVALASAITAGVLDIAIIEPRLGWASSEKVLSLIRRESPAVEIIWFGHENEIVERCLSPARELAGVARKSSAGFIALGSIVREILARRARASTFSLAAVPVPAFLAGTDGRVLETNPALRACSRIGATPGSTDGIEGWCADGDARRAWQGFCAGSAEYVEVRLRLDDDDIRVARITRLDDARLLGVLIETRATEINLVSAHGREQSNREMHDIALVFSHDLKEPVQQIMRLVRRLDERGTAADGALVNKLTQQLHTCAERASAMLDGMLEYLAVSASDELPGLTDLNECLEQALDNLRAAIDETDAEVTANELPTVAGDAYQLLHLFQNLIGNAIKFHGRARPRVRIEATSIDDHWRIAFHDNGIGIAEPFRERVFEMGKRLHTRDEYAGGGIGLTLCRRIVERHGGSIYIEGGEDGGSVVIVELPGAAGHVTRLA